MTKTTLHFPARYFNVAFYTIAGEITPTSWSYCQIYQQIQTANLTIFSTEPYINHCPQFKTPQSTSDDRSSLKNSNLMQSRSFAVQDCMVQPEIKCSGSSLLFFIRASGQLDYTTIGNTISMPLEGPSTFLPCTGCKTSSMKLAAEGNLCAFSHDRIA